MDGITKITVEEYSNETQNAGSRYFDPNITLGQIKVANPSYLICWGAREYRVHSFDDQNLTKSLLFKVTALKFEGMVQITLNGSDYYDVTFYAMRFPLKNEPIIHRRDDLKLTDVYFEDLGLLIDKQIETK